MPQTVYVVDPPALNIDALNAAPVCPTWDRTATPARASNNTATRSRPSPRNRARSSSSTTTRSTACRPSPTSRGADDNSQFVPLVVTLPQDTSLTRRCCNLLTSAPIPADIEVGVSDRYVLSAGPGHPATLDPGRRQARDDRGIQCRPADYITPEYAVPSLRPGTGTRSPTARTRRPTLYVEAVRPSLTTGDRRSRSRWIWTGPAFSSPAARPPDRRAGHRAGL